jgi:hypothetical protein
LFFETGFHYVVQTAREQDPLALASQVLELQADTTMPSLCFMFVETIINLTIYKFFSCQLLVYKKKLLYADFVSYDTAKLIYLLQKLFCRFTSILYITMSFANKDCFTSAFPVSEAFIYFSCLITLARTSTLIFFFFIFLLLFICAYKAWFISPPWSTLIFK